MKLEKLKEFKKARGPVLTVVMDGVGIAPDSEGNAVKTAYTPTLDMLMAKYPTLTIKAHGTAVGLPGDDDMGNSEVGHNALGSGQVFAQGAKLVSQSIESGKMFESDAWKDTAEALKPIESEIKGQEARLAALRQAQDKKKPEEITQEEKDDVMNTEKAIEDEKNKKRDVFANYAKDNSIVHQLIDLALLQNGMLKGAALDKFLKRSIELIK